MWKRSLLPRLDAILLCVLLAFCPLAYGGIVEPWRRWLSITALVFGMAVMVRRTVARRLLIGTLPFIIWALAVAAWGWLSTCTPRGLADRDTGWVMLLEGRHLWSGTMDQASSVASMLAISGALAVFLATSQLCKDRQWRIALATTMASSGFAVAVLGLVQKLAGDVSGLWAVKSLPVTVFGPFWYHANAGAFLNLCWPLTGWMFIRSLRRESSHLTRAYFAGALVIQGLALIVNVSKAGHFVAFTEAGLIAVFMFVSAAPGTRFKALLSPRFVVPALVAMGLVGSAAMVWGGDRSAERWEKLWREGVANEGRLRAGKAALVLAKNAGLSGFGPGTFEWVFPIHGGQDPGLFAAGRWRHAHNDWLEYLSEWGWIGFLILLAGPFLLVRMAWKTLRKLLAAAPGQPEVGHRREVLGWLLPPLFGVALFSLIDFPLQILSIQLYTAAIAGIVVGLMCDQSTKA